MFEEYGDERDELVSSEGARCSKDTEDACLVVLSTGKKIWVPKSQIHDDSEVYKEGTDGCLVIRRWIAEKNAWL